MGQVTEQFVDELISLVQAQGRVLEAFRLLLDLNGVRLGPQIQGRYVALAHRLREIQAQIIRHNEEGGKGND